MEASQRSMKSGFLKPNDDRQVVGGLPALVELKMELYRQIDQT
jgi:hypothetical protein